MSLCSRPPGKSSLMVALYRLVELGGEGCGAIRMDGVDISTLGLDFLRQSMAIISQVGHTAHGAG